MVKRSKRQNQCQWQDVAVWRIKCYCAAFLPCLLLGVEETGKRGMGTVHGRSGNMPWSCKSVEQNKLCLSKMVKDHVIRLFCSQPIALQRGSLYDSFLDIHLEALSLFAKHRSLLIAVWDWLDCFVALQAACRSSRRSSHLTVWPAFSSYCCAFLILSVVGRLARCWGMSEGGKNCPFLSSQAKKSPSQLCSNT